MLGDEVHYIGMVWWGFGCVILVVPCDCEFVSERIWMSDGVLMGPCSVCLFLFSCLFFLYYSRVHGGFGMFLLGGAACSTMSPVIIGTKVPAYFLPTVLPADFLPTSQILLGRYII